MITINFNFIMSWIVGILCALFWFATLIAWIWMDEPKKKSNLRPGEYINSEIEDSDENN